MPIISGIVAAASAVGGAISGALGGASLFSSIGSILLKQAVSIGISLLAQALQGKPSADNAFSVKSRIRGGGRTPRSFLIGKAGTAGSFVWQNEWGNAGKTPNAYSTRVICLSDLPIQSVDKVFVNKQPVTLLTGQANAMGSPVSEYRVGGKDHLWIKIKLGGQNAADNFLTDTASDSNRPWNADRIGEGCAYVIATSLINQKLFTGFPEYFFECTGIKLYDITRDDTAGGSGTQRWGNQSTWGGGNGDHLPSVHLYNIMRGIKYGGRPFYGMQNISPHQLPDADWRKAVNACRASTAFATGTSQKYRSGGEIEVSADVAAVMENLNAACSGRIVDIGGIYKHLVGDPGSPVFSITDDDIVSTQAQSFSPLLGLDRTINAIDAVYPDPDERWAVKPAEPIYDDTYEAQDGNRRLSAQVNLAMVPYHERVQMLMRSALKEARRFRRHTFILPMEYDIYEPGQVFSWTSTRNGYIAKDFRIDGMVALPSSLIQIDATEIDPTDYDYNQSDYKAPRYGRIGIVRPPAQDVPGFAFSAGTMNADISVSRPCLNLDWDNSEMDGIDDIEYQVRRTSNDENVARGRIGNITNSNRKRIVNGVLPNTVYEARAKIIAPERDGNWSSWLSATTGNELHRRADLIDGAVSDRVGVLSAAVETQDQRAWVRVGQILTMTAAELDGVIDLVYKCDLRSTLNPWNSSATLRYAQRSTGGTWTPWTEVFKIDRFTTDLTQWQFFSNAHQVPVNDDEIRFSFFVWAETTSGQIAEIRNMVIKPRAVRR